MTATPQLNLNLKTSRNADLDISILEGDCSDLLREVADNSIALIATDPPDETNFDSHEWDKPNQLKPELKRKERSESAGDYRDQPAISMDI